MPTGLGAAAHIFVADKGDHHEIADGLPQWSVGLAMAGKLAAGEMIAGCEETSSGPRRLGMRYESGGHDQDCADE